MGIFDFSRPDNYSKISEEWQIFESVFPDTGAFKYISGRKAAYLDDNTYRILRLHKTSDDGSMSEKDFFDILKKITVEPVYNKRHIYNYRCGSECFWIKLSMIERNGQWLGFVKDMTSMMQEITFSESFSILNSLTKLNNRESFLEELRILSESKDLEYGCLATFHINGINHMNKILGIDNSKRCISCAARTVSHFTSDNVIIGSTPYYEFLVFFKNKTEREAVELIGQISEAVHETKVTDDFGEALIPGSDARLSLNCGYCLYPDDSRDFNKLVNYSNFALFEILENTTGMIKKFELNTYEKEREFYTDAQIFCKIIDDNLFEYHMQPIVDGKTGAVYGYEALMRTTGNKYLNPFQMLEIAKKQRRTYDIEKKTFFNVMKILNDNSEMFRDKKLFINSIPDHMLNDSDFSTLYDHYGNLMNKVVIEITEQANLSDDFLAKLNKRREEAGIEIAFDDYGTGYSNTANLIRYNPEYIKIDRSLITDIDSNVKKQQLVSGVVEFAMENGIKTLAEGIETSSELATVINLGVDLIQGYYTSRPKPFILYEISREVKDEIVTANAIKNHARPFCITDDMDVINTDDISSESYDEIIIKSSCAVKLVGGSALNMRIIVEDGIECTLTLENVCINMGNDEPAISVGENSSLTIVTEGENVIEGNGIYVPETASFTLTGSGLLKIVSECDDPYGVGADINSAYGNITIDMDGILSIDVDGLKNIAIGGGKNPSDSIIRLVSGNISMENTGKTCVSIGNAEGNAIVEIADNCSLDIDNSSVENVSVGSLRASASVVSTGNIKIESSGRNVIGIGVLDTGSGTVKILGGNVDISLVAKHACCIGSNGGSMEVRAENSKLSLSADGFSSTGIGDQSGNGTIFLDGNDIDVKLSGARTLDIGSPEGTVDQGENNISIKII